VNVDLEKTEKEQSAMVTSSFDWKEGWSKVLLKAYQKLGMARRSLKNSVCHFSEEPI
jgi:hypothetical protein